MTRTIGNMNRESQMTMMKHQDVVEGVRETSEYLESKRLLKMRKELQAAISEINCTLRTLQSDAGASVNLAKADLQSEKNTVNFRKGAK